jgi:hypothetical protein
LTALALELADLGLTKSDFIKSAPIRLSPAHFLAHDRRHIFDDSNFGGVGEVDQAAVLGAVGLVLKGEDREFEFRRRAILNFTPGPQGLTWPQG